MSEARRRHAEFFLELCEAAEPFLRGSPDQALWFDRLEFEWGNIQAAFNHYLNESKESNAAVKVLRLGVGARRFFEVREHWEVWKSVRDAMAASPEVEPALKLRALMIRAEILGREIRSAEVAERELREVLTIYEESIELARSTDDTRALVLGLGRMSFWMNDLGDVDAARRLADQALNVARDNDDPYLIGHALLAVGFVTPVEDRKAPMLDAATWLRRAGDSATLCMALLVASVRNSSSITDLREDRELNAEALRLAEQIGYVGSHCSAHREPRLLLLLLGGEGGSRRVSSTRPPDDSSRRLARILDVGVHVGSRKLDGGPRRLPRVRSIDGGEQATARSVPRVLPAQSFVWGE